MTDNRSAFPYSGTRLRRLPRHRTTLSDPISRLNVGSGCSLLRIDQRTTGQSSERSCTYPLS